MQSARLLFERIQNEVRTFGDADLWQDDDFVTQRGIVTQESIVFANRVLQVMMALAVSRVEFRPRRCEEYAAVIVMFSDVIESTFAGDMLKSRSGVDQSAIEEDPPRHSARIFSIRQRHRECAAREGRSVNPRQARSVAGEFLPDDPPSRLFDNPVTAPRKLRQQR